MSIVCFRGRRWTIGRAERNEKSCLRRRFAIALGLTLLAGLTGCSPATVAERPVLSSYPTAQALRQAFVAVGGDCDPWSPPVQLADRQTALCGTNAVISIYKMNSKVLTDLSYEDAALPASPAFRIMYGKNWILVALTSKDTAKKLGGVNYQRSQK
jgi:hypothetical protein